MRQASNSPLENVLPTSKDESENFVPMPPAVREQVVELLAQILVADYELFQGVRRPTVKTPPAFNRKLKLVPLGKRLVIRLNS